MNRFGVAVFMLIFACNVEAKFFFMADDNVVTKCIVSQFDKPVDIKAKLEEQGLSCSYTKDNFGTFIFTCEGIVQHMYFFTEDLKGCDSLRDSIVTMLGHE